jgi:heme/copper-type cytochrome/quinol oxidase subunit 2
LCVAIAIFVDMAMIRLYSVYMKYRRHADDGNGAANANKKETITIVELIIIMTMMKTMIYTKTNNVSTYEYDNKNKINK